MKHLIILLGILYFIPQPGQTTPTSNTVAPVNGSLLTTDLLYDDTIRHPVSSYPAVAKRMNKLFPTAAVQQWIKQGNYIFVSFFRNGNKAHAVFTKKGDLEYALAYLKTTELPRKTWKNIKSNYADHYISSVREIISSTSLLYMVIVENDHEYISLRAINDEIEEMETIRK